MGTLNRRCFMQVAAGSTLAFTALGRIHAASPARPPNVLFIAVDDLNDWVGPFGGHPQVQTPHIDRLAQRGCVFTNATCPAPICTPARTALLTGKNPSTSGLYFLAPLFRDTPTLASTITLPQALRQSGYHTMAVGKVFHGKNDPASLDEDGGITSKYGPQPPAKLSLPIGHPLWDWGAYPTDGSPTPDDRITDWAIQRIRCSYDKPFFLGAGFFRPHVPMYAPPKWFDLYPAGKTQLPPAPPSGYPQVSEYAAKLTHAAVAPRHLEVIERDQWEHAVRAYLASVSYTDDHVGRLLDALADSEHADNTIIVFWADHGFHLGERQRWGKRSLWAESTRVPMIIAGPGITPGQCDAPVGTIDLYPTVSDLCGVTPPGDLDGRSLTPLLGDPKRHWPHATVCTFGPGNHAVRSHRWHYITYADRSQELYDQQNDPNQWHNLADDPAYAKIVSAHRDHLPKVEAALVPNSAGSDSPLFP